MGSHGTRDPETVLANLRAHLDEHRELAEERETRVIELEQRVDALLAETERQQAAARTRERVLEQELESVRARRDRAEAQLVSLRTRRSVRAALWLADALRPLYRLLSRGVAPRDPVGGGTTLPPGEER